jgi:hypothetical protein
MDGLHYYLDSNWQSIRANKELNLPDQRKLVAEFRCNESKDQAIGEVAEMIESLAKDSEV